MKCQLIVTEQKDDTYLLIDSISGIIVLVLCHGCGQNAKQQNKQNRTLVAGYFDTIGII